MISNPDKNGELLTSRLKSTHVFSFDAIAYPLKRLVGLKDVKTRVEALAASVALSESLLDRYSHQLSGGQKVRVEIARALASDPKLLILDEPTAALDVSVQAAVLKLLHKLRGEFGLSYLLITHDVEVVRLMCERVMVMLQGCLVEEGPTKDVLAAPKSDYDRRLMASVPRLGATPAPNSVQAS